MPDSGRTASENSETFMHEGSDGSIGMSDVGASMASNVLSRHRPVSAENGEIVVATRSMIQLPLSSLLQENGHNASPAGECNYGFRLCG